MRIKPDVSPEFNAIQIFRLECALKLIRDLPPLSPSGIIAANWIKDNGPKYLGIDSLDLSYDADIERVLKLFEKPGDHIAGKRERAIVAGLQKVFDKKGRLNWKRESNVEDGVRTIFRKAIRSDRKARKKERDEHLATIESLINPDIKIVKGKDETDEQQWQKVIFEHMFRYELVVIPKNKRSAAKKLILASLDARFKKGVNILEEAIDRKKALLKRQGEITESALQRNTAMLADCIGISDIERDVLVFLADAPTSNLFHLLDTCRTSVWDRDDFYEVLGKALGYSEEDVKQALNPSSVVRESLLVKKEGEYENDDEDDEDDEKKTSDTKKDIRSEIASGDSRYGVATSTTAFSVPEMTWESLRQDHADIYSIVGQIFGKEDTSTDLTIEGDFPDKEEDIYNRIAFVEECYAAKDPIKPGRKGRIIVGEAGGGKNTTFRLICQNMKILAQDGKTQLPVKGYLVGLSEHRGATKPPKQVNGKERIYAWATADYIAAQINKRAIETGEGHIIMLGIDEGDKDITNPKVTGSSAKGSIKDYTNFLLENLRNPAFVLANVSHVDQEHIIRRLGPPMHMGRQRIDARFNTYKKYFTQFNLDVNDDYIGSVNERFPATPGVIEGCIEDAATLVRRKNKKSDTPMPEQDIIALVEKGLREIERANQGGVRSVPARVQEKTEFDFGLCNAKNSFPKFKKVMEGWTQSNDLQGMVVSLTGPDGSGKTQLVKWFANQTGKRVITIDDPDNLPHAVDVALRDDGIILIDETPKPWRATRDSALYRFAQIDLNVPIFCALSYEERPTFAGQMDLYIHLDYMQPKHIKHAWKKYMEPLGLKYDKRIINVDDLTPLVFEQVARQIRGLQSIDFQVSVKDALKYFMQYQNMEPAEVNALSLEKHML